MQSYNTRSKKHTIKYDDGEVEQVKLSDEKWELLQGEPQQPKKAAAKQAKQQDKDKPDKKQQPKKAAPQRQFRQQDKEPAADAVADAPGPGAAAAEEADAPAAAPAPAAAGDQAAAAAAPAAGGDAAGATAMDVDARAAAAPAAGEAPAPAAVAGPELLDKSINVRKPGAEGWSSAIVKVSCHWVVLAAGVSPTVLRKCMCCMGVCAECKVVPACTIGMHFAQPGSQNRWQS